MAHVYCPCEGPLFAMATWHGRLWTSCQPHMIQVDISGHVFWWILLVCCRFEVWFPDILCSWTFQSFSICGFSLSWWLETNGTILWGFWTNRMAKNVPVRTTISREQNPSERFPNEVNKFVLYLFLLYRTDFTILDVPVRKQSVSIMFLTVHILSWEFVQGEEFWSMYEDYHFGKQWENDCGDDRPDDKGRRERERWTWIHISTK